jgi:hypothetical protein
MFYSVIRVVTAAGLIQDSLAHVAVREDEDAEADVSPLGGPMPPPGPPGPKGPKLNWANIKALVPSVING